MSGADEMIRSVQAEAEARWRAEQDKLHALGGVSPIPTSRPASTAPTDDEHDDETERPKGMSDRLLTLEQLAAMPPPRPLIEGVLDLDNTGIGYGRRGSYKSFMLFDMGLCVASGRPWHGRRVTQGVVLYVVAEGVSGVYQRAESWLTAYPGADPGERLLILPEPVNLLNEPEVNAIAVAAAEIDARFVIFDTLARCMVGGDENSAKDIGIAVAGLDIVRRATGAHVHAVHHSGKDAKAGARGSSALEAAADTVLEIVASDSIVTLRQTKQKNRPEGHPMSFRAEPVGRSIVLVPTVETEDEASDKERAALVALHGIAGSDGAGMTAWIEAAAEFDVSRTTVRRARVKALEQGWITDGPLGTKKNPRYLLTGQGRAIALGVEETTDDQG